MFKLFLTFLKIGAFTFGGGYAMVPLIEDELVAKQELLTQQEFIDYLSILRVGIIRIVFFLTYFCNNS